MRKVEAMDSKKMILEQKSINAILYGDCERPKELLGYHTWGGNSYICSWNPKADKMWTVIRNGEKKERYSMERIEERGLFLLQLPKENYTSYYLEMEKETEVIAYEDPYRFLNPISLEDRISFENGTNCFMYQILGAHKKEIEGVEGIFFAFYAPNARRVSVLGDWNEFDSLMHPMERIDEGGIFELFIPEAKVGMAYEYEIKTERGEIFRKSDPYSFGQHKKNPHLSLIIEESEREVENKKGKQDDETKKPIVIYEVYPVAYKKRGKRGNRLLSYRQLAKELAKDALLMGYTHIQLKGILEYETEESLGTDVTHYFAPSRRHGTREDFQYMIDYLHKKGLKVILEWCIASFGTADYGLKAMDGEAVYEYENPLLAVQAQEKGLLFHYGKGEVQSFLLSSAFYWIKQFQVDGFFIPSVASMLYQDYGKIGKEWLPNPWGGTENLEAISFLQLCNSLLKQYAPQVLLYTEDNSHWIGITEKASQGGLGFDGQLSSEWLEQYLTYSKKYPNCNPYDFWKMERFVSYDRYHKNILRVARGENTLWNGTLIQEMAGEYFNRFASLRILYGYFFAYPSVGKILSMGEDFVHWHPCDIEKGMDWQLLEEDIHRSFRMYIKDLIAFYKEKEVLRDWYGNEGNVTWFHKDPTYGIFSFVRRSSTGKGNLLFLFHHRQEMSRGYLLTVPNDGEYRLVFHSDSVSYGGVGTSENEKEMIKIAKKEKINSYYQQEEVCYFILDLPPFSMLVFEYDESEKEKEYC